MHQVLRTGQPELVSELPESLLEEATRDEQHGAILRELGLQVVYDRAAPARGVMRAAITLVSGESERRYGTTDLELAQHLARRAALAVDNARLYDQSRKEIGERGRVESELRMPEARYRALVEDSPRLPMSRRSIPMSEEPTSATRARRSRLCSAARQRSGRPSRALCEAPATLGPRWVLAEAERTGRTGEPFKAEYRQFTKTGRSSGFGMSAMLVRDERGEPLYWQGVIFGISELKRVEEALRKRNEYLASLLRPRGPARASSSPQTC